MLKKIYCIDVVSKQSGKHAMYFYVKAISLQDAIVYAADWLIPDALEMAEAHIYTGIEIELYSEVYDSDTTY